MILRVVECNYCDDKLKGHPVIHVCKVQNIHDETEIDEVHLCNSCYEYYVLKHPAEQEIKLLEHRIDVYYNILDGDKQ